MFTELKCKNFTNATFTELKWMGTSEMKMATEASAASLLSALASQPGKYSWALHSCNAWNKGWGLSSPHRPPICQADRGGSRLHEARGASAGTQHTTALGTRFSYLQYCQYFPILSPRERFLILLLWTSDNVIPFTACLHFSTYPKPWSYVKADVFTEVVWKAWGKEALLSAVCFWILKGLFFLS